MMNTGINKGWVDIKTLWTARELTTNPEYRRWLQYLEDRYIVKE